MGKPSKTIVLDIETIPTQSIVMQEYILKNVKAPANYKDADKIAAYINEAKPEALDKAAFFGQTNHIVCIGFAIDDGPVGALQLEKIEDEAELIKAFYGILIGELGDSYGNTFVGHNISGFDLRVLKQRSMILRCPFPGFIPFDGKPWDKNPYDTMIQWAGAKESVKLETLAQAFGLPGKTTDGSQVYKMWQAGQFNKIQDYCMADVELTRQVYKRMEFLT